MNATPEWTMFQPHNSYPANSEADVSFRQHAWLEDASSQTAPAIAVTPIVSFPYSRECVVFGRRAGAWHAECIDSAPSGLLRAIPFAEEQSLAVPA